MHGDINSTDRVLCINLSVCVGGGEGGGGGTKLK